MSLADAVFFRKIKQKPPQAVHRTMLSASLFLLCSFAFCLIPSLPSMQLIYISGGNLTVSL